MDIMKELTELGERLKAAIPGANLEQSVKDAQDLQAAAELVGASTKALTAEDAQKATDAHFAALEAKVKALEDGRAQDKAEISALKGENAKLAAAQKSYDEQGAGLIADVRATLNKLNAAPEFNAEEQKKMADEAQKAEKATQYKIDAATKKDGAAPVLTHGPVRTFYNEKGEVIKQVPVGQKA